VKVTRAPTSAFSPLQGRVVSVLRTAGGTMAYHALMRAVFPPDRYPRAWNYRARGGPPACAMPLGRAISELRCSYYGGFGAEHERCVRLPDHLMRNAELSRPDANRPEGRA
jgi:hypothetical protein